jgi:hypothetical protein
VSQCVQAPGLAYVDHSVLAYVREISVVQGHRRIIHHPNYDSDLRPRARSNQPATSYLRTTFTVEDGLSSNVVNAILQTRDGFLWIATDAGLNRFDGRHFTPIYFRGPKSTPQGIISSLAEGPDGDLWIGTNTGLVRISRPGLDQFDRASSVSYHTGTGMSDEITFLHVTSDGTLWVGTSAGLYRFVGNQFQEVIPNSFISRMEESVDGHLLFIANGRTFVELDGTRVIEHYDEFVEKSVARAKRRTVGNPFDAGTEQGPQIDDVQFEKVLSYIDAGKREGAELLTGGKRAGEPGYFVEPTVFANVRDEMKIAREEIFGPVMSIMKFHEIDEVLHRANNTTYGLAAAVWTRSIDKAHAIANNVKAGTVWVNCFDVFDAAAPFGGFKQSGIGREMGEYALQQYTEVKTVTIRL